jgi:hypothetical protein
MEELDWKSIEVGKKYQLEDGYHFQAEVEVIGKNIEISMAGYYYEYTIRIIKPVHGCTVGECKVGKIVDRERVEYLTRNLKFKEIESGYDYLTPGWTMEDILKGKE